jgi:predicted MFS family arabinose efflux permease
MAFSFLGPARQGLMVEFVGPARRGNAIALSQVALNASRILAPFIAAAALNIRGVGAAGAFFIMTALYVGAMACTVALPATRPVSSQRPAVLGEIWGGIRYVARTPGIRILVPSYVLVIMCGFPYVSVLPGLVANEFGREASEITWLLTVNAIGGLATSLAVASLADSPRAPAIYTAMCLVFGVALIALGVAPSYALLFVPMFFVGAAGGGFQTLNGALVSHLADPAYFGRVVSLTFLAFAASSVVAITASGVVVCGLVVFFELAGRITRRDPLTPEPVVLPPH